MEGPVQLCRAVVQLDLVVNRHDVRMRLAQVDVVGVARIDA